MKVVTIGEETINRTFVHIIAELCILNKSGVRHCKKFLTSVFKIFEQAVAKFFAYPVKCKSVFQNVKFLLIT